MAEVVNGAEGGGAESGADAGAENNVGDEGEAREEGVAPSEEDVVYADLQHFVTPGVTDSAVSTGITIPEFIQSAARSVVTYGSEGECELGHRVVNITLRHGETIDLTVDPFAKKDDPDSGLSQVLSFLVNDNDDDTQLLNFSLTNLISKLESEFETVDLQNFAVECIIGYIERNRLRTKVRLVAAFGIIICFSGRTKTRKSHSEAMDTVYNAFIFLVLRCGFAVSVENASIQKILIPDDVMYVFTRLFLGPASILYEKLEKVLTRWSDEFKKLDKSGKEKLERERSHKLESFRPSVTAKVDKLFARKKKDSYVEVSDLLNAICTMGTQRLRITTEIVAIQRDILVQHLLKNVLLKWDKYDKIISKPLSAKGYADEFLETVPRPAPECSVREMLWLVPEKYDKVDQQSPETEAIMNQAFTEALTIPQRDRLIENVRQVRSLKMYPILKPSTLHDLVEYNPTVAIEVLLKVLESQIHTKDYLEAMVNMEMSVHSLEVVNKLTMKTVLSQEFLYMYVSNCIKTCERIQDKYVQNRLVRLLCVFLQSLIRSEVIDIQGIYIEVIVFLVAFSRIREAASLFRSIRHAESEEPEVRDMISKKLEDNLHLTEPVKTPRESSK